MVFLRCRAASNPCETLLSVCCSTTEPTNFASLATLQQSQTCTQQHLPVQPPPAVIRLQYGIIIACSVLASCCRVCCCLLALWAGGGGRGHSSLVTPLFAGAPVFAPSCSLCCLYLFIGVTTHTSSRCACCTCASLPTHACTTHMCMQVYHASEKWAATAGW